MGSNDSEDTDGNRKWASVTPINPLTIGISGIVAFVAVWQFLVTPLHDKDAALKEEVSGLQTQLKADEAKNAERWDRLPNVVSLAGKIEALVVQLDNQQRAVDTLPKLASEMAQLREAIVTEQAERKAVDTASLAQRTELNSRLQGTEQIESTRHVAAMNLILDIEQRLSRMEGRLNTPHLEHGPELLPRGDRP